jgi:hypothetical protein
MVIGMPFRFHTLLLERPQYPAGRVLDYFFVPWHLDGLPAHYVPIVIAPAHGVARVEVDTVAASDRRHLG